MQFNGHRSCCWWRKLIDYQNRLLRRWLLNAKFSDLIGDVRAGYRRCYLNYVECHYGKANVLKWTKHRKLPPASSMRESWWHFFQNGFFGDETRREAEKTEKKAHKQYHKICIKRLGSERIIRIVSVWTVQSRNSSPNKKRSY